MQTNFFKYFGERLLGKNSLLLMRLLEKKENLNEFYIAKKTNLTINQVRNMLYELSSRGLVSFTRKKDKRKGWFIYYWTLNKIKCLNFVENLMKKEIEELKSELEKRKNSRYYYCKRCNKEITEEQALEENFICGECGGIYELFNNIEKIKEIENKILRRERDLKLIYEEIEKLKEKEMKKEKKVLKKEENKKKIKTKKIKKK